MNIEFIIPTYVRKNHLKTIICSLLSQTSPDWKAHIVADNPPHEINEENIKFIRMINDDRIKYTRLDKRHGDWGHTPRNYGLDNATGEWIVMTGEDNYYVPTFVENMLNETIDPNIGFVFCSFLHNQTNLGNTYYPVKAKLELNKIDIGCYMFKRNLSKDIRLNTTMPQSDYYFMVDYLEKNDVDVVYVDEVLYVHN